MSFSVMYALCFMFNYFHNIGGIFVGGILATIKIDQADLIVLPDDTPVSVFARFKA
jgi:hypothetical protein